MNDEELHRLLRQHPVTISLPSSFDREVWARIEAEDEPSAVHLLMQLLRRVFGQLSRPAYASATFLIFAVGGLGLGWKLHRVEAINTAAFAYQQAINPLLRAHQEDEP